MIKAIKSLSSNKAFPIEEIPIKILKNSIHIYSMNVWLTESFPRHWKEQMLLRFLKKETIMKRKTIAQCVCSQLFKKFLKSYCLNKLKTICKVNSQSILQVSKKYFTGFDWKMENYFEYNSQSWCSFYGFVRSVWYPRSLSIVGKSKCV